jgi:hypothetical protein
VLGGVKGSLALLGGSAALEAACAPCRQPLAMAGGAAFQIQDKFAHAKRGSTRTIEPSSCSPWIATSPIRPPSIARVRAVQQISIRPWTLDGRRNRAAAFQPMPVLAGVKTSLRSALGLRLDAGSAQASDRSCRRLSAIMPRLQGVQCLCGDRCWHWHVADLRCVSLAILETPSKKIAQGSR